MAGRRGGIVTGLDLRTCRVLVVTTSLLPGYNDLWRAARPHVGELIVVGARFGAHKPPHGEVALTEVDAGRGLIWRHLRGLRGVVRAFRPDLLHVNGELWGLTAQELLTSSCPVAVHGAENIWEHGGVIERVLRRRLVDRAVSRISGYASWNHDGAEHVRALRRTSDGGDLPTLVLPAVIPPEPFRAASWRPPERPEDLAPVEVLLVGRAVPAKGFDTVIEAAARLEPGAVRITMCGDGVGLAELVRLAAARRVELTTLGEVQPDEIAALLQSSHVLVQPSRTTPEWAEQFGRTVAEAMMVGTPVVVSSSGELPHLVGNDPRAVFTENDASQLAQRLSELTADPGSLAALSRDQRTLADRYLPDTSARAVVDFWAKTITASAAPRSSPNLPRRSGDRRHFGIKRRGDSQDVPGGRVGL
jgi:glycosyltransferase involved in cell wall biosynthesis